MVNHRAKILDEVRENYAFYEETLPTLSSKVHGKYALLRKKEIVDFYNTIVEAQSNAHKLYQDGLYSIQQVAQTPVELGFYSYAGGKRST